MGYEERGGPDMEATIKKLQAKFGSTFHTFLTVKHPKDVPDEVIGRVPILHLQAST